MKSRQDFSTDAKYNTYLRHYYAGQCMASLAIISPSESDVRTQCYTSILYADELVRQLDIQSPA